MSVSFTFTHHSPAYGTSEAAGIDLRCIEDYTLKPGERKLFKTGVFFETCSSGVFGKIMPRSSLAYKHGIDVMAGVIDSDYRGDIGVILINHGQLPVELHDGDRIAQLVLMNHLHSTKTNISAIISADERGTGGFGSTGKN